MLSRACSLRVPGCVLGVWAGCHPHAAHVALSLSRHPAGPEPGRCGKGLPSQTQAACIDMSMFPGLFTVLNCRALAESPQRGGINHNSGRNDNSLLNSWPLRASVASWGRAIQIHLSSCTKCRVLWNGILMENSWTVIVCVCACTFWGLGVGAQLFHARFSRHYFH